MRSSPRPRSSPLPFIFIAASVGAALAVTITIVAVFQSRSGSSEPVSVAQQMLTRPLETVPFPTSRAAYPLGWPSWLTLPPEFGLVEARTSTTRTAATTALAKYRQKGTVASVAQATQSRLESLGWTVQRAESGQGPVLLMLQSPGGSGSATVDRDPQDDSYARVLLVVAY